MATSMYPIDRPRSLFVPKWGPARIEIAKYENGALAVQLILEESDEPLCVLSVNMAHGQDHESEDLPRNCFYVKAWSENREIVRAAISSGWFKKRGDIPISHSGYVQAEAWELLDEQQGTPNSPPTVKE